jgi:hypothetical protein
MKLICALSILTIAAASSGRTSLRKRHDAKQDVHPKARSILEGMSNQDLQDVLDDIRGTIWQQQLSEEAAMGSQTCESPLLKWREEQIKKMGPDVYQWLEEKHVFEMPILVKAFFDRLELGEYLEVNGDETEEIIARHESAKAFWESVDVDQTLGTERIKLLGAHGTVLQNELALTLLLLVFGQDATVSEVQHYIETNVPDGYNNPLFTLNAVAVKPLLLGLVPPAIVMGDGVLAFLRDVGLGRDGPDFVFAHEFGHQMQYGINAEDYYTDLPTPEQTRLIELMADAFGGYYLAHSKGGNLPVEHIQELHEAAFVVGDCNATADGHHGTPLQRECAAEWGAAQAMASQEIMHPDTLREAFDAVVDDIVALEESVCKKVASRL